MRRILIWGVLALAILVISGPAAIAEAAPGITDVAEGEAGSLSAWRVYTADANALIDYDVLEGRGPDYFLIIDTDDGAARLRGGGLRVELVKRLGPIPGIESDDLELGANGSPTSTWFGGYYTQDEHYRQLDLVKSEYPGLATVYDYGDSWRKVNGVEGANDLMVICLTNKQEGDCELKPNSSKPRALIMAAIHPRELVSAELASRLIWELTRSYGVDADITMIMDTTEIWVIPTANPDGTEIVESGISFPLPQRKNANTSELRRRCRNPPWARQQHGVDLNRNATFGWGGPGANYTNSCHILYAGTGPASEPEQKALETLFTQLWPDQKGPDAQDSVPASATGVFISLHSSGEMILLPGEAGPTPNDIELRIFAHRMGYFNKYMVGTGPDILYRSSGTTTEHAYHTLGVASMVFEVGDRLSRTNCSGFAPDYSCIDSAIWPQNRDAILYSLKVAGSPYRSPRGPTTLSVDVPNTVSVDSTMKVTAQIDDDALGTNPKNVGRPLPGNVVAAEYYLDTPRTGDGAGVAMTASDGAFDDTGEGVEFDLSTSGLTPGKHAIYVRGRNAAGQWGPLTAASFTVFAEESTLLCMGRAVTVDLAKGEVATAGPDVIRGTPQADHIVAFAGDDFICGMGGADTISGDQGNDTIDGGHGNDDIRGNTGNDTLIGGAGDDDIYGGAGDDNLDGGDGSDRLFGEAGDLDTCVSGDGLHDFIDSSCELP